MTVQNNSDILLEINGETLVKSMPEVFQVAVRQTVHHACRAGCIAVHNLGKINNILCISYAPGKFRKISYLDLKKTQVILLMACNAQTTIVIYLNIWLTLNSFFMDLVKRNQFVSQMCSLKSGISCISSFCLNCIDHSKCRCFVLIGAESAHSQQLPHLNLNTLMLGMVCVLRSHTKAERGSPGLAHLCSPYSRTLD